MHSELLPIPSQHTLFTRSAKIMQIESYLTAAEILGGSAYWFGYPRPDHSNMLTAVQKLVEAMSNCQDLWIGVSRDVLLAC